MNRLDNKESTTQLKEQLYDHCRDYVDHLLNVAKSGISDAQEAANQEGKSSAGDKFETHRAMMHLQLEGFIKRLEVAELLDRILLALSPTLITDEVRPGALVETDRGMYYIAVSAPPIELASERYICLSIDAPIYKAIAGHSADDLVEWCAPNGEEEWSDIISVR